MKYTVVIVKNGFTTSSTTDCTKSEAIEIAKEEALANSKYQVFIEWFRASDQQHGYLNPGGNHEITGESW